MIPNYLVEALSLAPRDRAVTMILRHSIRYPILDGEDVYQARLTPEGEALAEEFGRYLKTLRRPGRLMSTPVNRCMETAARIARGAGWPDAVTPEERISYPFIEDAWLRHTELLAQGSMPAQVLSAVCLAVDAPDDEAGRIDLLVTHDTNLVFLTRFLLGARYDQPGSWPNFLEGLLIWRDGAEIRAAWRGAMHSLSMVLENSACLN